MEIMPFVTERFFAAYEFTAAHTLSASDCETLTVRELLELAGTGPECLLDLTLGYTESQGKPQLRERIAATYDGVSAEEVVVLAAPEEGIFLTVHALLEPGDEVVVLTPCYDSLSNVAAHLGATVVPWPVTDAGDHSWRLDIEQLEASFGPRTRVVIVNFPHNPTGLLPPREAWETIVELAAKRGVWLLSDEMYRGLEPASVGPLPSACELTDRVVTLSGLSKTHGLPGLRMGWLVVPDGSLRERIEAWKDYTTICAAAPSEALAEVALGISGALAARSRDTIRSNLELVGSWCSATKHGLDWYPPVAGPVGLVRLPEGVSATTLSRRLFAATRTLLLPATGMGLKDDRHVRLGLGRRGFPAALEALDRFLGSTALADLR
jgi:aspartate/methionine/tyrosine aminotransferase